jgi:hypothetical protein
MSRDMCLHQAVLTERGLGVQDEFVFKHIMKFLETRRRVFIVEVPVNCRTSYIFKSLRVTEYL